MQDLGHPSIGQLNLKSDWIIELSRAKEERETVQKMAAVYGLRSLSLLVAVCCWTAMIDSSEFPERECCDSPSLLDVETVDSYSPPVVVVVPQSPVATSTEVVAIEKGPPLHPDTSNFLFPEFIPELSLDLGYPLPPPPLNPLQPPDVGVNAPTTPGTGTHQIKKMAVHVHQFPIARYVIRVIGNACSKQPRRFFFFFLLKSRT